MQFSTFQIMSQPPGVTSQDVIQDTMSEIQLSERLGFDNVWLTEHHASPYGLCPSPSVLAGAVAMRTRRLGIGYAVNVTPLHHPLRLAEQIALVDHLSRGRVIAGFGPGYSPYEYNIYGVGFDDRHKRHQETLEIVLKAWREDRFDYEGTFYRFKDATILPKLYQQPHPPVAITAGKLESITQIARGGFRPLLLGAVEQIQKATETYRQVLHESESTEKEITSNLRRIGVLRLIYVTESDAKAVEQVRPSTLWLMRMQHFLRSPGADIHVTKADLEQYLNQRVIAGSPQRVAEGIAELQTAGAGEILCWFKWGKMTHEQTVSSMKMFSEYVMPQFQ